MKKLLVIFLLSLPMCVLAQNQNKKKTLIGLNLAPLPLNALELNLEQQLASVMNIRAVFGLRLQESENSAPLSASTSFQDYINLRNQAYSFGLGLRFMDHKMTETPYFAIDFTGVGYNERIVTEYDFTTGDPVIIEDFDGFVWGATGTVGFLIGTFNNRLLVDLGLQGGYSPPSRDEELSYYYPGVGYTTYGHGLVSVKGLHIQPVVALHFNLRATKKSGISIDD